MKSIVLILSLLLTTVMGLAQSITEVYFPQYIQGTGNFNPADDRKVPFVSRLKISGLLPAATYRYYNRFVLDTTSTSTGDGIYILVKDSGDFVRVTTASLGTAGRYGEFKTDSTGSYTGWFANEAGVSSTYIPGNAIYLRLILNNGAGGAGIVHRLTVSSAVKVIGFGADAASGTGLRSTALKSSAAKQFVFLYDNLLAQGRPVTGTFIESDGTDNSIANGYAPFYADSVNGVDKAWGTIIPNTLPNGVQRIDRFALSGAFGKSYFPYPVIESWHPITIGLRWPSVNNTFIDTKNPAGGLSNVLVIDGSRVLGIAFWISGDESSEELITLQWASPAEEDAAAYRVEKSTDGGQTFVAVNTITKGANRQIYSLKDTRSEKPGFYRVVMTAKDGTKTTSDVLKVAGVLKISTYPNPVTEQLIVKHPQAEAGAALQVIGVDGRQAFVQNVKEGAVQTTVNVKTLVSGNYFVVYSVNGQRQSKLFIKQ